MGKNAKARGSLKQQMIEERKELGIVQAVAKNIRMSPRKVRHVIDLIRGKSYEEALAVLQFTPNIAAEPIIKVLKSAAANADHNLSLDIEGLIVLECFVDCGFTFKRMHPTTMGRARIVRRRSSHITIKLATKATKPRATRIGGTV